MFNVMKAQLYQLKRENSTYYIFIAGFVIMLMFTAIEYSSGNVSSDMITQGSSWIYNISSTALLLVPFLVMLFTSQVCGADMEDKTLNYEMLTGIDRTKIFFGRFIVSAIMSLLAYFLLIVLPMPAISAVFGWGHFMSMKEAWLRMGFVVFPIIKLTAVYCMFSFMLANKKLTILLCFILLIVEMIFSTFAAELWDTKNLSLFFSSFSFEYFLSTENIGLGYFDGEDVMVLKSYIDVSQAWKIALSSMGAAAVFLLTGNAVFHRKDMN